MYRLNELLFLLASASASASVSLLSVAGSVVDWNKERSRESFTFRRLIYPRLEAE
ncbi:uncharacterized protein BO95DRAFT_444939 [Aspergillus brunneoviolaceus CBS 621.78]|uniref:Uncharacterized protein n=1 Tax=Aspergillus brunneoviolaceus CBS 621.78 TaxID=1450534 RepID=A0ACD1G3H7_9EURO|nr:hypothetical protein BO95DRAFT_444939 [Aspergillus brunneoviolaceus CBS 621.78]RAH43775.1 hypothetical protein BO95DRAFT_444939 [Aspergillus brunneoviolaceus CBS 621.78]